MNTLLVPTDFSAVADNALNYALNMASRYHLDVHLVHIVQLPIPTLDNALYLNVPVDLQEPAKEQMILKISKINELWPSVRVESRVELGHFLDSLERYSEEIKPVAVVMGITGEGTALDKMIGSNTILTMRSIKEPLLVVPIKAAFKAVDKLCFACDLQDVTNSTPIFAIREFALRFNAEIHLLNVDFENRHFTAETPVQLEALNSMFGDLDIKFHFIDNENVEEAIHDFIEREKMDMLVMLPKKHSFFEGLFRKSQTKEMLYHSHIPILALHHW